MEEEFQMSFSILVSSNKFCCIRTCNFSYIISSTISLMYLFSYDIYHIFTPLLLYFTNIIIMISLLLFSLIFSLLFLLLYFLLIF